MSLSPPILCCSHEPEYDQQPCETIRPRFHGFKRYPSNHFSLTAILYPVDAIFFHHLVAIPDGEGVIFGVGSKNYLLKLITHPMSFGTCLPYMAAVMRISTLMYCAVLSNLWMPLLYTFIWTDFSPDLVADLFPTFSADLVDDFFRLIWMKTS